MGDRAPVDRAALREWWDYSTSTGILSDLTPAERAIPHLLDELETAERERDQAVDDAHTNADVAEKAIADAHHNANVGETFGELAERYKARAEAAEKLLDELRLVLSEPARWGAALLRAAPLLSTTSQPMIEGSGDGVRP
jgi:cytochrome c551/c552